jgi:hypothetical protein
LRRDAPADGGGAPMARLIVIGLAVVLTFAVVLVLLNIFFADRTPELTQEAFQAALQQWEARGPESYDLDVQIGGAQPGVAHVEVRNGVVRLATRDGKPLQEWNKDEWSIPSQFEALEREFEFQEDPERERDAQPGTKLWLRGEFDPTYGYPRHFHRYATNGAPEVYWHNSLQPR